MDMDKVDNQKKDFFVYKSVCVCYAVHFLKVESNCTS